MTTVNELMLSVSQYIGRVHTGIATGGSSTSLEDSLLKEPAGTYADGTIWFLSGDNIGGCVPILTAGIGEFEFSSLADPIIAGDQYAAATSQFPYSRLKMAVEIALREALVPGQTTMAVTNGVGTLPAGVSNVKHIYFGSVENFHWTERAGSIIFDQSSKSGTATVIYATPAITLIDVDNNLPASVDSEVIKWTAVVYLWREYVQHLHKDDPTAIDMLNEAKTLLAQAEMQKTKYTLSNTARAPRYSKWGIL